MVVVVVVMVVGGARIASVETVGSLKNILLSGRWPCSVVVNGMPNPDGVCPIRPRRHYRRLCLKRFVQLGMRKLWTCQL